MEKRIVFLAFEPLFISWVRRFAGLFLRLFLDGAELDRFLGFLDRAVEITRRLWRFFVGFCGSGMYEQQARIIVLILSLHLFEGFLVVSIAVEMDVIAGDECLIVTGRCIVFLRRARLQGHGQNSYGYRYDIFRETLFQVSFSR